MAIAATTHLDGSPPLFDGLTPLFDGLPLDGWPPLFDGPLFDGLPPLFGGLTLDGLPPLFDGFPPLFNGLPLVAGDPASQLGSFESKHMAFDFDTLGGGGASSPTTTVPNSPHSSASTPFSTPPGLKTPTTPPGVFPSTPPGTFATASAVGVGTAALVTPSVVLLAGFRPPPGLPHPAHLACVPAAGAEVGADCVPNHPAFVGWRIPDVMKKLKKCRGNALVSPLLKLGNCSGIRMHFVPAQSPAAQHTGSKAREPAEPSQANACIRLKLDGNTQGGILKFELLVGCSCEGQFVLDLQDRAVHEITLNSNWCEEVENDSLRISLKLVQ